MKTSSIIGWTVLATVVAILLLGVVPMVLVYAYVTTQDMKVAASQIEVLTWRVNRKQGQEITKEDLRVVKIPVGIYESLSNVMKNSPMNIALVVGGPVTRDVKRNDFVRFSDLVELDVSVGWLIPAGKDMRAFPLLVDPGRAVGEVLRVNDRIDVMGMVSVGGQPVRAYTLIENVRLAAFGGRVRDLEDSEDILNWAQNFPDHDVKHKPGEYRTVTIEVQKDAAVELGELMAHVRGEVWIVVRNPKESPGAGDAKVNRALLPVLREPLPDDGDLD